VSERECVSVCAVSYGERERESVRESMCVCLCVEASKILATRALVAIVAMKAGIHGGIYHFIYTFIVQTCVYIVYMYV